MVFTHPHLFEELQRKTNFLNIPPTAFRQRFWHIENNFFEIPKCKNCENFVLWDAPTKTYRTFCSIKCSNTFVLQTDKELTPEDIKTITLLTHEQIRTLQKNNPILYGKIINKTSFLPEKTTTLQRFWHISNNTFVVPLCEYCKTVPTKWDTKLHSYRKFCSTQCSAKHENTKKLRIDTTLKKFNVKHFNQQRISNALIFLNDKKWLEKEHLINKKPLYEIAQKLNVDPTTITNYFKYHNIIPQNVSNTSREEKEIVQFLQTLIPSNDIICNVKNIISPYELDIYIPKHNLAIEVCVGYWHSDKFKPKHYHKQKHDMCAKREINLLTIYDVEWNTKQDIVKSILRHKINATVKRIDARKCNIIIPTTQQQQNFLKLTHIQGYARCSFSAALSYNNEIVSLISFIKRKDQYELIRFSSKLNTTVRGGFSKLLKYSLTNLSLPIITFADLRWSKGTLYQQHFKQIGYVAPSYVYVSYKNNKHGEIFHRSLFRREFLEKRLDVFDPELTEFKNCDNNHLYRLWDCGKIKFYLER